MQTLLLILEYLIQSCKGEKFDKEGEYVKKWVPELKDLSKKFIHKPWELIDEKFKLGRDYPFPIVKHEEKQGQKL